MRVNTHYHLACLNQRLHQTRGVKARSQGGGEMNIYRLHRPNWYTIGVTGDQKTGKSALAIGVRSGVGPPRKLN